MCFLEELYNLDAKKIQILKCLRASLYELKNGTEIWVGQVVMDQNSQGIALITNSRTAWPT